MIITMHKDVAHINHVIPACLGVRIPKFPGKHVRSFPYNFHILDNSKVKQLVKKEILSTLSIKKRLDVAYCFGDMEQPTPVSGLFSHR